jgi:hypothetical protein
MFGAAALVYADPRAPDFGGLRLAAGSPLRGSFPSRPRKHGRALLRSAFNKVNSSDGWADSSGLSGQEGRSSAETPGRKGAASSTAGSPLRPPGVRAIRSTSGCGPLRFAVGFLLGDATLLGLAATTGVLHIVAD